MTRSNDTTEVPAGTACRIEDDGGPLIAAIEAGDEPQAILVRVGPVWYDGVRHPAGHVWIEYQEHYLRGLPAGPVLLTPAAWRQLAAAIEARIAENEYRRAQGWRRAVLWVKRGTR